MRVLMIGFDPTMLRRVSGPGDTQARHVKYAAALRRRFPQGRMDVIVRTPPSWSAKTTEVAEGLVVHPIPCARPAFALGALWRCAGLARREHLDVVTTQTPFDDGLIGVWLKRRYRVALNVQMRSSFLDHSGWARERPVVRGAFNRLGKWVAARADTVRVVSRAEHRRLAERFPHLEDRLVWLHPLIDRGTFEAPVRREELAAAETVLRARGLGNGLPVLLFVGRFSREKNVAVILQAFALAQGRGPEAALVLAGDGPLRATLERQASALGIGQRVVWLGPVGLDALRPWYGSATGLLLPSSYEGFPRAVVEAYLMGTPAVVTPFVSARELVRDGETGFVAPDFGDPAWLGDRMEYLLRHPEEARAMGRRGRAHIESSLLPEREYLDRLVGVWEDTAVRARRKG